MLLALSTVLLGQTPTAAFSASTDDACQRLERSIAQGDSLRFLNLEKARAFLEDREALLKDCGDLGLQLDYMELHSTVCYLLADYECAAAWSNREIELCMDAELPGKLGLILNGKANFLSRFQQWDKAHTYLDQALPLCMEAQDTFCWSMNLDNRGVVLMRQGRREEARQHFEECLTLREQHRDTIGLGYVCENLSWAAMENGDFDEALKQVRRALRFRRATGENGALAGNINNIGEVHQSMGRCDSAIPYYEHAVALARKVGYQDLRRHALERLAQCALCSAAMPWKIRFSPQINSKL
jgi:tetratricopeptide (TPR) repeat protein